MDPFYVLHANIRASVASDLLQPPLAVYLFISFTSVKSISNSDTKLLFILFSSCFPASYVLFGNTAHQGFLYFYNQSVVNSWWSMSSPQTFSPHNKCLLQITCHYKAPGVECERDIHLTESIDRFALVLVSVVPYLPPPQQG